MNRDRSTWPRLAWLSRILPIISFCALVEQKTDDTLRAWNVDRRFFDTLESSVLADNPDVWTDGSLVADDLTGSACGAGIHAHASGSCWFHRRWRHLDLLPRDGDLGVERCTVFDSIPGPLQTAQRAELCFFLALQGLLGST